MACRALKLTSGGSIILRMGEVSHVTDNAGCALVHMRNGDSHHVNASAEELGRFMAEHDAGDDALRTVASAAVLGMGEVSKAAGNPQQPVPDGGGEEPDSPVARAIRERDAFNAKKKGAKAAKKVETAAAG